MDLNATALRLIDLLYQGLEDQAAFDAFAEEICIALNANVVALSLMLDKDVIGPTSTFGVQPDYLKKYIEHYHFVNTHAVYSARKSPPVIGAVVSTQESCPDQVLLASEYYNDFLRPQKLFHIVGTYLELTPQRTADLAIYPDPHATAQAFEEWRPLIATLVPHMQRVRRMAAQIEAGRAGAQALDRFDAAVFVVSVAGRVLLMNRVAEQMLFSQDGFESTGGCLRAMHPREDEKLKHAIYSVCAGCTEVAPFDVGRRSNERAYQVRIERFAGAPAGQFPRAAIMFVADPERAAFIPLQALTQFYGLTLAEGRLCNQLLKGMDLSDVCGELKITRNTGRAHLRSIFDKLGVNSQGQLVALLARSLR